MPAAAMTSPTVSSIRALAAELIARERWSRARLADHQRQALASLVRHAATASPYYRERLARWTKGDVLLADLPVLTHAMLMAGFDGIVCDPRVRLADLERHVASANPGALHLGGYRVFVTGGASGSRGIFLYSRAEWTLVPANYVRWLTALGLGPGTRLATDRAVQSAAPRQPRLCRSGDAGHSSAAVGAAARCRTPGSRAARALGSHRASAHRDHARSTTWCGRSTTINPTSW